jgi:hypothetical protein
MPTVISSLTDATPEWLTDTLRAGGHLPKGRVDEVRVLQTGQTGSSDYARLAARYSEDAADHPSRHLFLKYSDPGRPAERWRRVNEPEVAMNEAFRSSADIPAVPYPKLSRGDGADMRRFPFVPCYAAAFDPDTCRSHLLFADMTPTHRRWQDIPQPMSLGTFGEHLACLARLHAAMWGNYSATGAAGMKGFPSKAS